MDTLCDAAAEPRVRAVSRLGDVARIAGETLKQLERRVVADALNQPVIAVDLGRKVYPGAASMRRNLQRFCVADKLGDFRQHAGQHLRHRRTFIRFGLIVGESTVTTVPLTTT